MKTLLFMGLTTLFSLVSQQSFSQCQGDYNGDGIINIADLLLFIPDYGLGQNCVQCDMNNNGVVDQQDITTFEGYLGASCATIPTNCPADYDGNGIINVSDLLTFNVDYSLGQNCVQCDLNGDGTVGPNDVTLFNGLFGTSCSPLVVGCQGDYNNDGIINTADLLIFVIDYGLGQNCVQCDMNNNGIVDQQDITTFQGLMGASCATIPTDCPADYNGDGIINVADLLLFLPDHALGQNCVQCDLNGDGIVGQNDITLFQGLFGTSCAGATSSCIGDYNGDGVVNIDDKQLFLADFALGSNCAQCDINGDGIVDNSDIDAFKGLYGKKCENAKSLGSNEPSVFDNDLLMYPNPSNDFVNIIFSNGTKIDSQSNLQVKDISGRMIENLDSSIDQGALQLNVKPFESGTYFVTLTVDGKNYTSKLIVK